MSTMMEQKHSIPLPRYEDYVKTRRCSPRYALVLDKVYCVECGSLEPVTDVCKHDAMHRGL